MATTLPIESSLPALKEALAASPSAIIVAEPGAGKTTRVPLAFLDADWLSGRSIVMLEPRRLAARAAARRMADSLSEQVGETVGYTVRLERKVSSITRIEVVTEGVLTRRLQNDPMLENIGLLIFDEFHERSLDGDLGFTLALEIQRGLREDLKILVMSATLDANRLSAHLGDAPVINAPGRVYPVETRYGESVSRQTLANDVSRAIGRALNESEGSILVFLPGESEIRRTAEALSRIGIGTNVRIAPLYGAMSFEEQDVAIRSAPPGLRKVVLATTIAETSLTIDGIGVVIDCGLKRVPRFDPATGMTSLETVRVSLASADQRRGRAGRLGPGVCYRLWPEEETRALRPHDVPEILQADLSSLALELANWGVADPVALPWLDPPPEAAYGKARALLQNLDALDGDGHISSLGKSMAQLPLHPRLAHMVVQGKDLGAGYLAADLAALLAERDILDRTADADIALRIEALRSERSATSRASKERVKQAARQIRQIAKINDGEAVSIGLLVALAWPDRIAQRRGARGRYRMAGGGGAALPEHDLLANQDFLAIAITDGSAGDQRIFLAAALTIEEIEEHFASNIMTHDIVAWDFRNKVVMAHRQRKLGALLLSEQPLTSPDPGAVAQAMCEGIRQMGLMALPWNEAAERFRTRVTFLKRLYPDDGWPDLDESALRNSLESWLKPYLAGMTRASHLGQLELLGLLQSLVPSELLRKMDRLAPARLEIPSGAEVRIDYDTDGDPVLRARLQEMFGLTTTPKIADGRAKLRIELLSPAGRPLAVTQSLETFWTNVYPQVRAEMRGRYPKHVWPEDPLTTAPVKPRRVR